MAAQGDKGVQTGTMDIGEHQRTWNRFLWLIKWSLIGIATVMAFLAIFRTHG